MRNFFDSLRSDLLDRRFLPVLAVLGVALVAALAFAVLGGGSSTSSTPPATSAATGTTGTSGPVGAVAITPAPAANQAVAETTSGSHQHSGAPRNPFTPLPSSQAKSATVSTPSSSSASSSSSGSSSSGSSSSSSTASGTATPKTETTPKPIAPTKRVYIHYHVTAEFGLVPPAVAGAPAQPAQLKSYPNMALDEPLPSKDNPQLLFLGVVLRTGKDAVFALTGAAILHGSAVCKPSPTQCQAIQLPIGQSETLEVVEAERPVGHLRAEAREHLQERQQRIDRHRPQGIRRDIASRAAPARPGRGADTLRAALRILAGRARLHRASSIRCSRRLAPALRHR